MQTSNSLAMAYTAQPTVSPVDMQKLITFNQAA